jgi:hypothetical protein
VLPAGDVPETADGRFQYFTQLGMLRAEKDGSYRMAGGLTFADKAAVLDHLASTLPAGAAEAGGAAEKAAPKKAAAKKAATKKAATKAAPQKAATKPARPAGGAAPKKAAAKKK